MATDPQTLLTAANCYQCYGTSAYMLTLMKLGLLKQLVIQGNAMADTSPQTLLTQAQCYDCNGGSIYSLMLMELALLAQLIGGGVGGGNATTIATTDPVGNGTTKGDLWINQNTNNTWFWTGSAWQKLIGP